jgi:MFS family permease
MKIEKVSNLYSSPFLMMAFANFFTVSSFGSFFLFPLFITNHGGSKADIGIAMGAFTLSSVLCRPWISEMIDRVGRKKSYTIGCLIMSLLPPAYLFLQGDIVDFFLPLMLIRLLHGIGLAICFTASFTYIADIVPETRLNEGIGMFGITGLSGLAIGPVIAEIIILKFGFSIFFLSASGMAVLGLLIHLAIPESYVNDSFEHSQPFFSVLVKKRVLTVAIMALIFGFGLAAVGGFVAPFAKERHLAFASIYYLSYSSAAIATRFLWGRLTDRIGEERVIPYALVLSGSGLLILILPGGNMVLTVSGLMAGCGHGFLFPCLNSMAVRNAPIAIRGKITGVFTGGIDAGAFLGSIILGYVGEWAGFRAIFLSAGISLLAGLAIYRLRITRENRLVG